MIIFAAAKNKDMRINYSELLSIIIRIRLQEVVGSDRVCM